MGPKMKVTVKRGPRGPSFSLLRTKEEIESDTMKLKKKLAEDEGPLSSKNRLRFQAHKEKIKD